MATTGITGVLGQSWRADVTEWGAVVPWDGSPSLDWHVAADDRWHTPAEEVAVRQTRLHGAPVFETRLRVPGGDAVHRVWSAATDGGCTVVEITNDSPLPIACAFSRADLFTNRPPTDVPIQGIDLPADTTTIIPIGHRAAVAVALGHGTTGPGGLPSGLPASDAVARGWVALAERASRLELPDERWAESVTAARCDLLLDATPAAADDPIGFLLGLAELARMGEADAAAIDRVVEDVALAVEDVAPRPGWEVDAALAAAGLVLARAGERRAGRDLERIVARRPMAAVGDRRDGLRAVAAVERRLARGPVLLPEGIPDAWRGADFEVHGVPVGPATVVSFAVRWHGTNAAVLWELDGEPVELSAPALDASWSTTGRAGEALWRL